MNGVFIVSVGAELRMSGEESELPIRGARQRSSRQSNGRAGDLVRGAWEHNHKKGRKGGWQESRKHTQKRAIIYI